MATYVNDLRLKEISTGDESGTWGTSTNTNLELIGEALGYATQQVFSSDADATTTIADGASDPARAMYFKITSAGSLTATRTCTIAPNTVSRVMFIENATTGSQSIAISQGSGANVTIATGKTAVVYLDGAGATAAVVDAMAGVDPGVTDTLTEVLVAGNTSGGTNIELSTTDKVQFRDAAIYINSSVDGQLDIVADTEIQIAATTVDVNGALDVSGTALVTGVLTTTAATVFNGGFASNANSSLSGSLAIGQTSFSGGSILLDLHGSGSSTGSQASFYNDHNTSGFQIGLAGNTSGDVIFYNVANTDMDFYTNNALRFSITNSEIVVNDQSADVDFRVESDTITHALFVQGSDGFVGIGASSPAAPLSVYNASNPYANFADAANYFNVGVITSAYGLINSSLPISFQISDTERMGIDSSGGLITNPAAGGHAVFNEAGVDADFRVESDGNANMLFVDGGNNVVGLGTANTVDPWTGYSPTAIGANLMIGSTGASSTFTNFVHGGYYNGSAWLQRYTDVTQSRHEMIGAQAGSTHNFYTSADVDVDTTVTEVKNLSLYKTGAVFNEDGVDADFRVESDTNTHALFVDAGNDKVAIRNSSAINSGALSVNGSITFNNQTAGTYNEASGFIDFIGDDDANLLRLHAGADAGEYSKIEISTNIAGSQSDAISVENLGPIVINQDSIAERDFRVESDTNANMFVVDASTDRVGVGVAAPLETLHVAGSVFSSSGYYITVLQGNAQLTNASTSSGSNASYIGQGLITVVVSDAKAKENFGAVEENECLNKIVSLSDHVKKFDWIDEDWKREKGRTVGMVAQEVYEDHSEFVHKPENYNDDGWAIRYQEIVPTLIKAFQEQQELIKTLESRIAALES
jgi:hypothetical protein